jgi:hypothetical protein
MNEENEVCEQAKRHNEWQSMPRMKRLEPIITLPSGLREKLFQGHSITIVPGRKNETGEISTFTTHASPLNITAKGSTPEEALQNMEEKMCQTMS